MKVWAFYRRSTDRQELSIDDQRKEVHALAESKGWEIIREFEPSKGWGSGLTIDQDPTFQEMLRMAERGDHGVARLVVYDVSRFGRLAPETKIYYEQHLLRHGIRVVYVKGDFKNDNSIGDIITKVVQHSEAYEYSRKLSELVLRGCKSHAALGHSTGGQAPFGYDRVLIDSAGEPVKVLRRGEHKADKMQRVVWVSSPSQAPVVRDIFESYERGLGLNSLAQKMNSSGVSPSRGRHWSKSQIHYMLRNRVYVGDRIYNKRSYKGYRRGERGEMFNAKAEWVTKTDAHDPIVDRDIFERIQVRLGFRDIRVGRTFQRPYLLAGLAVCGNCGYKMVGHSRNGKSAKRRVYTCSGYMRIGRSVCRSVNVGAEALESKVVDAIREDICRPDLKQRMRTILEGMIAEEFGDSAADRLAEIQTQSTEVERQLANVLGIVRMHGKYSEALVSELSGLEHRRDELRKQVAECHAKVNQRVGAETLAERILGYMNTFDSMWSGDLTVEERKRVLQSFVHMISVSHSDERIEAKIHTLQIPIPETQRTPALRGLEPLIARVHCGGGKRLSHHHPCTKILLKFEILGKNRWPYGYDILRQFKYPDYYPFPTEQVIIPQPQAV